MRLPLLLSTMKEGQSNVSWIWKIQTWFQVFCRRIFLTKVKIICILKLTKSNQTILSCIDASPIVLYYCRLLPILSVSFALVVLSLAVTGHKLGGPPLCYRSCRVCLASWLVVALWGHIKNNLINTRLNMWLSTTFSRSMNNVVCISYVL